MKNNFTLLVLLLFATCFLHGQNWQLAWSDEFDYVGSPNAADWSMENWAPGNVNEEDQAYTDRLENVRVENGTLVIDALKDGYNGWEWTSGRVHSSHKHDALYGRIEVRAILPEGKGTWPAIWMLPSDWVYGNWPTCGEIDIMEHVGKDPGNVHASIHTESYNHSINTQVSSQIDVPDFNTAYHVYAVEWTPTDIKMFVDDNHYFTFQNEETGYQAWPFDKPFHVILNVAMGGTWGGRIDRRLTSARMTIDYVRIYEYDAPVDIENPTAPTGLAGSASSSSIDLNWIPADDNYSVKEYDVYVNDTYHGTTIWHNYLVTGLNQLTSYNFKVVAKDYSGNVSAAASADIATIESVVYDIPAKIEAEDFDVQSGVQTEETTDDGGGLNVGWIDDGDWMEYNVGVSAGDYFVVDYRFAAMSVDGEIHLKDESGQTLATTVVPVTGGWQTWATISSTPFQLPAGANRLRVLANTGGFNLNWLEFRSVPDPANDTEPPTAPDGLAKVATATTINLSWNASTDNVAVEGYNLFLDGGYVGSTTGLSYLFTGLTKRTGYTLGVSAFDAAGNESAISTISARTSPKNAGELVPLTGFISYPNPVQNNLFVEFKSGTNTSEILIYNLQGKLEVAYTDIETSELIIDVSRLTSGVYVIKVVSDDYVETSRFIKQ